MPRLTKRHPAYRLHKPSGRAVVTLDGKDCYLGAWNTPESRAEYDRLIALWLSNGRRRSKPAAPSAPAAEDDLSVTELVVSYLQFVQGHYVKDGRPTSEVDTTRQALRFLRKLFGPTAARKFSPKKLKVVRQAMLDHDIVRAVKVRDPATGETKVEERLIAHGLSRRYVNKQVNRIRRMFGWAVEEELVDVAVHAALLRVKGVKKGVAGAREKPRVKRVAPGAVDTVLPLVPPAIRAMIEVQQLCGCRPQEVVQIRAEEIDRTGVVWEYRPLRFKTQHHDDGDPDRERVIFLGPRAQAILKPHLADAPAGRYLFSPIRSEHARNATKRQECKSPMTPSQAARKPTGRTRAPLRDCYDVASYRRSIRRACLKAGVPPWCPLQLRHTRLTEVRKRFGLEASKACGGHREIGTTQHYAEQDRTLARSAMSEIG